MKVYITVRQDYYTEFGWEHACRTSTDDIMLHQSFEDAKTAHKKLYDELCQRYREDCFEPPMFEVLEECGEVLSRIFRPNERTVIHTYEQTVL